MNANLQKISSVAQEESRFLPDFCQARMIFLVIIMAELIAFILTLGSADSRLDLWVNLALISLFIQWIALGNIILLCISRRFLQRLSTFLAALGYYSLSIVVTLIISVSAYWFAPVDRTSILDHGFSFTDSFILRNVVISAIISAVVLRYFYVQHQWKTNVQAEARSRIQALQARIRPHFLFNSMNTIASLTRTNPELAEKTVEDLADLFRASLGHKDKVTLHEELEFTQQYINIEQLRLGDRLKIRWDIGDDVDENSSVPALILQPLVENAIYHGIEPQTEGGEVLLSIQTNNKTMRFSIKNPLPGKQNKTHRSSGNHMAQDNIQQRLKLAYGDDAKMRLEKNDSTYVVTFNIPVENTHENINRR